MGWYTSGSNSGPAYSKQKTKEEIAAEKAQSIAESEDLYNSIFNNDIQDANDQYAPVVWSESDYSNGGPGVSSAVTASKTSTGNNNAFTPSEKTSNYQSILSQYEDEDSAPTYSSRYDSTINEILNTIKNRGSFDLSTDANYQQLYNNYQESYKNQAQKAMRDTMAQAQAATGGYGSTYSQIAGQQAYDNTMQGMNDQNLQLMNLAYDMFSDDRANDYNMLNAYQTQDNTDYSRYRDDYNDWYNNRNYYANQAQNSYSNDYTQYRDSVSDTDNLYSTALSYASAGYDLPSYLKSQLSEEDQAYFTNIMNAALAKSSNSGGSGGGSKQSSVKYSNNGETATVDGTKVQTGGPYSSNIGLTENQNKVAAKVEKAKTDAKKYKIINNAVSDGTITQEQGYDLIEKYDVDVETLFNGPQYNSTLKFVERTK